MHFSQSKSTKCEIFGCLLDSLDKKMKKVNLYRGKVYKKAWNSAHIGFWVCYLSPKIWIFQEPLIVKTWNLHHLIWHTSNPKNIPLKPFQCIFPSQNQQNVKFLAVCFTPFDKKMKKVNLYRGKVYKKAWKSAHIGFCLCQSQCTMWELCLTSTFWVMMVFLDFWQEGWGIGFWNMV